MSEESQKQYYLSLLHRVESANLEPVHVQVLISRDSPNLTEPLLHQATRVAARKAESVSPDIQITDIVLLSRIDLGYMTPEEFAGPQEDKAEIELPSIQ